MDTAHGRITFDLIEFLTGDAAKQAWKKANPGSDQDGPDDDYYIVNDNAKLRTLPVAGTVTVKRAEERRPQPGPDVDHLRGSPCLPRQGQAGHE